MNNIPVPAICPECSGHYVLQADCWTYRCDCSELATTDVYLEHDEIIQDVTDDNGRRILAALTVTDNSDDED